MAGSSWDWTCSEITAANGAERGKKCNAIRGGSWYANAGSCRTDSRGEGRRPSGAYSTVGFRPAAVFGKDDRGIRKSSPSEEKHSTRSEYSERKTPPPPPPSGQCTKKKFPRK